MKNDVNDFPPLSLTDYLVQDLYQFYKQFNNRLLLRLNLYWLLEIQVKKLVFVYDNESFNRSKGSHKVVRKLYGLKEFIPDLDLFIRRLNSDPDLIGRLNSIQTFDYVTARYGSAFEVFRSDLPLVEDMFELYWILSEHLHKLGFE